MRKPVLRQLLAGVLLMMFSFSIAPKQFLHDAIANHSDKMAIAAAADHPQLSNTGFICKCDNLVAESPFTDEVDHFSFSLPVVFSVQQSATLYHCCSSAVFYFTLRGPPAPAA